MISVEKKTVLLIGGAGFIGHHLALRLRKTGAIVHVMDSLGVNNLAHHAADDARYTSDATLLPILYQRLELLRAGHIPLHVGDANDIHQIRRTLSAVKPGDRRRWEFRIGLYTHRRPC